MVGLRGRAIESQAMKRNTPDVDQSAAPNSEHSDPAAVFACAVSLQSACLDLQAKDPTFNISESYNGRDQFMREIMRVGELFEAWSVAHVLFDELGEVWPYMLEEQFADACLKVRHPGSLSAFGNTDCFCTAFQLKLPLHGRNGLPIPVDLRRQNPLTTSRFKFYQILSVREHLTENHIHPFRPMDDPADEEYGKIFYGFYGIDEHGEAEHIADRHSYTEARSLTHALVPSIGFPESPKLLNERAEKLR